MKTEHFEFKDDTTFDGEKVTEALCVAIVRKDNHYYLLSKESLKNGEEED